MMDEFHFLRPWWLIALLPWALLIWRLLSGQLSHSRWEQVCDTALLPYILEGRTGRRSRWPDILLALAGSLVILALAGPVWERLPQPVFRNESALVVVFDLSRSMDATDLQPSRLVRARYKVADLLAQRREGQTALVVFAGDAFVVTPLTDDVQTINAQLAALNTSLMPVQGSRPESGLILAQDLLHQAGLSRGEILLITDGGNPHSQSAVEEIAGQGFRISVYAIGTAEGAPVSLPDGGFLQDSRGAIVVPGLDIVALRELASSGGGSFQTIRVDNGDIQALLGSMSQDPAQAEVSETDRQFDGWQESGPWLLLLVLPVVALSFRRGLLTLLLVICLPLPRPAQALEWQDLWRTADQQAQELFESGQLAEAAEKFKQPEWKAAASYRAGDFETTAQLLEQAESPEALYNRANALARRGEYEAAIESYQQVLALNPKHEDAEYNKKIVEQQLRQQQQNQQQNQPQDNQQQEDPQGQQQQPSAEPQAGDSAGEDEQADRSEQGSEQSQHSDQDQQADDSQSRAQADQEKPGQEKESDRQQAQSESEASQASEEQEAQQGELADSAETNSEQTQQMTEQWLRKIPDDPGLLLRNKFKYQYSQRRQTQSQPEQAW